MPEVSEDLDMANSLGLEPMEIILILVVLVLLFTGRRLLNFIMGGQDSADYDDEPKPLSWPKWFLPAAIFMGVITFSRPWANPSFTYTKVFVTLLVLTISGIVGVWAHRETD